jgi:hypothetical protein
MTMKKIIYFISLCLALGLTSCNDYLTVDSPDQLSSESFWRNQTDVESALASSYAQLYLMGYSGDEWSLAEIKWPVEAFREDVVSMGNDAVNYPNWVELYNYTYTNGNSQFSTYWRTYYRGISFANQIIEKTANIAEDKLSADKKKELIAEGHFLRGFYHMQLLLNWERIVIRDQYLTSPEDPALQKPLATRAEAWDFIINDLKAAEDLPESYDSNNIGRATRGAAYSYLGMAYLTRAYEEADKKTAYLADAVSAFDNVKGYDLVSDFVSMFNGTNKNSKESIFEIQFSMSDANGAVYRTQAHRWIGCSELWGWDEILPSETLMNEYMKEGKIATTGRYDSRLYNSVFFQCDYFNDGTGKVYGSNYNDWFCDEDGNAYNRPAFRKFMPATKDALSLNECAINIPLMRYANVLLMKAEALNEQGHPELAIPLINKVRSVHGDMPGMTGTTQAAVRAQIEHERMIEFPLENYRWYDLRRWGKLTEALKAAGRSGFDASKNSFYPVPQIELNSNNQIQ